MKVFKRIYSLKISQQNVFSEKLFFFKCSECVNMHHSASKCMQNELYKPFVHESIKEVIFTSFLFGKICDLYLTLCDCGPCTVYISLQV